MQSGGRRPATAPPGDGELHPPDEAEGRLTGGPSLGKRLASRPSRGDGGSRWQAGVLMTTHGRSPNEWFWSGY